MKKIFAAGLLIALCGCNSAGRASIGDISFEYPQEWGNMTLDTQNGLIDPYEELFFFEGFYGTDGIGTNSQVDIYVRPYDEHEKRYEEVCAPDPEGLTCDEKDLIDMYEQKLALEQNANMTIAGFPALYEEGYGASGGVVFREYKFFTDSERILIYTSYSVGPFYDEEYWERVETEEPLSILDLIREDLGQDIKEPYKNLVRIFPQESKQMQKFFAEVDAMIASIKK